MSMRRIDRQTAVSSKTPARAEGWSRGGRYPLQAVVAKRSKHRLEKTARRVPAESMVGRLESVQRAAIVTCRQSIRLVAWKSH